MDVLYDHCAGLDVHKDTVVACVRVRQGTSVKRTLETFSTTTSGLLALSEWLSSFDCTHVAMEATGVYWKPVWHVLEGHFELVLANAAHIRNVPGRKSDVNDAQWIADLLAHGLIRPSFVPDRPVQELRDLTRTRKQLTREIAQHTLRIQKVLEDANIKLSSVLSDTLGKAGRAILDAIVGGQVDPGVLAGLAGPRVKASRATLVEALHGRVTDHHRFLLKLHLGQVDALEQAVRDVEARIEQALAPFRTHVTLLTSIPGISKTAAHVILAELGFDMARFGSDAQLRSWAGLCPRMDESAGKRRSVRIRKGAPWLKTVLVQCAWAAARKKDSYLQAQFHRIRARRGAKKAAVAVAATLLTVVYHVLQDGTFYEDLGPNHFDLRNKKRTANRLLKRLADLGLQVEVKAAA